MRSGIKFGAVAGTFAVLLAASWFAIYGVPADAQAPPARNDSRVTIKVDGNDATSKVASALTAPCRTPPSRWTAVSRACCWSSRMITATPMLRRSCALPPSRTSQRAVLCSRRLQLRVGANRQSEGIVGCRHTDPDDGRSGFQDGQLDWWRLDV